MGQQLTREAEARQRISRQQHQQQQQQQLRRRSSVDSVDNTPSYISSGITKPIGSSNQVVISNQSQQQQRPVLPADIVVVSEGNQKEDEQKLVFPPLFKPLVPIGHETLPPHHPQLNCSNLIQIGSIVQEELRSKAEFAAKEQQKLAEKIKEADSAVGQTTLSFVNDRQRRGVKLTENFSKIEEINSLIEKCEADLRKCVRSLDTLNRYLSPENRLEKFSLNN